MKWQEKCHPNCKTYNSDSWLFLVIKFVYEGNVEVPVEKNQLKKQKKKNKAISMMRGKSLQSNVEMSKELKFVAAISD